MTTEFSKKCPEIMTRRSAESLLSRSGQAMTIIGVSLLALILGYSLWTLPPFSDRMVTLVSDNMAISGVENPVTAVLLNFRGYDTLLEIGVLLLAVVAVFSIAPSPALLATSPPSPMATLLLRLLLPFVVLVGGYILWVGSYAPGGAFQAGAVLAAGGILFTTVTARWHPLANKAIPFAMGTGLLIFVLVALATMLVTGNFLQYPETRAGMLILLIEAAATMSIAIILTLLFVGGEPGEISPAQGENKHTVSFSKENRSE